jgi:hypothetical protein
MSSETVGEPRGAEFLELCTHLSVRSGAVSFLDSKARLASGSGSNLGDDLSNTFTTQRSDYTIRRTERNQYITLQNDSKVSFAKRAYVTSGTIIAIFIRTSST